jgi:hypothetical protein
MRNAYHCRRFAVNAKRPSALARLVDAAFAGADVVKIKLSDGSTAAFQDSTFGPPIRVS